MYPIRRLHGNIFSNSVSLPPIFQPRCKKEEEEKEIYHFGIWEGRLISLEKYIMTDLLKLLISSVHFSNLLICWELGSVQ